MVRNHAAWTAKHHQWESFYFVQDRMVDVFVGGEFVEDYSNKNERQVLILNESGEVFAAGKNTSGTLAREQSLIVQHFRKYISNSKQ